MSLLNFFSNNILDKTHSIEVENSNDNSYDELKEKVFNLTQLNLEIIFSNTKHSSARVKGNILELKISKKLPNKIKEEHIESLVEKMIKKIKKNPHISHLKNPIDEFRKAILQRYCYIGNRKIDFKINTTKTRIKCEYCNEIQCIISLPHLNYETLDNITLQQIEKNCAKLLCKIFQRDVEYKVQELNNQTLHSKLGNITFNYVTSKWGHCTSKNDIMLHIALLNAPIWVYEYVILHELAHTIHKNHSKKFWDVCNSLTPHTKASKLYLKNSPPILWRVNI